MNENKNENEKKKKKSVALPVGVVAALVCIVAAFFGCENFLGTGHIFSGGSSGTAQAGEKAVESAVPGEEQVRTVTIPQDGDRVVETDAAQPSESQKDEQPANIEIRVENLSVFVNDAPLRYPDGDLDALSKAIAESLKDAKEGAEVHLRLARGDNEVCNAVENAVTKLGMKPVYEER